MSKRKHVLVSHPNRATLSACHSSTVSPSNRESAAGTRASGGMRICVKDAVEMLAARVPEKEIIEDFPCLEPADIGACLQYAAIQSDHTILAGTVTAA